MIEKPLKKHGGKPSVKPVNQVMKTLLQESHFSLKEFAKFAGVGATTVENLMYFKTSPVAHSCKRFWTDTAKKIAAAFGVSPEELYPVETWENELGTSIEEAHLDWKIDMWRKTNTLHLVNSHDRSHQLFSLLMHLSKEQRRALMQWAMRKQTSHSMHEQHLIASGLRILKARVMIDKSRLDR